MIERICKVSSLPVFNPHIMRKIFFTTASNLNINRDIVRVLLFKKTPKDILTYLLSRSELREAWQQIIDVMPLEKKVNGKVSKLEEDVELITKVVVKAVRELRGNQYITPSRGIGLLVKKTDKEILEEYLMD